MKTKTAAQINRLADHRRRRAIIEAVGRSAEAQRRSWIKTAENIAAAIALLSALALIALIQFYR